MTQGLPDPTDAAATELAHEILSRSEYARFKASENDFIIELFEWVRRMLEWLNRLQSESPALHALLLTALMLVALGLIAHIVWTIYRALHEPDGIRQLVVSRSEQRDFQGEASALAEQGRYLEASHRLLLGSLARLARARVIDLAPQDTNRIVGEALAETELPAALRSSLRELITRTERSWFGVRTEDPMLYTRWRAVFSELADWSGAA